MCSSDLTIDLVEEAGFAATWFVTHDTPLLQRLRNKPNFEIGIHPNFNKILSGDCEREQNAESVLDELMAIIPEAKSVRSHSLTQSSQLCQLFQQKKLTHDCNHFIPAQANIFLHPWLLPNGLVKVPYFWEDDSAFLYNNTTDITQLAKRKGLKVFNFHPIHVFLNTDRMERYEDSRPYHRSPEELLACRNKETPGVRTSLKALMELG